MSKTNADKFGAQKLMARPVLVVSDAEVQILKLQNDEDFLRRNFVLSNDIFNENFANDA